MNQNVIMPLSNDPRKLPLNHIHYSSIGKLITTINVLRLILKVSLLFNYRRVVIHTTTYVTMVSHKTYVFSNLRSDI